jgi:hypothetical protein
VGGNVRSGDRVGDDGGLNELEPNFIARPYRGVSVQEYASLDDVVERIKERRVYRRTEFIVAVCGDERALVQVEREEGDDILVAVKAARILAHPGEIGFVRDERVDVGNANHVARVATDKRVTVVEGRFQHVNFIWRPQPIRVRIVEVVPPYPPKLVNMAETVLEYDEDLPPLQLDFVRIDLRELATGSDHYLFPCRCAGLDLDARVDFLDAGPPEAADWTLVGCERSRQIHAALYGQEPHARIDFCPLLRDHETTEPTLLKCCLNERGIQRDGARMMVPWGANLEEVRIALKELVE